MLQKGAQNHCPDQTFTLKFLQRIKSLLCWSYEQPCLNKVLFFMQVDALMSNLLKLRNEDPTVKSLVVSQFTRFLDVLELPLRYSFHS